MWCEKKKHGDVCSLIIKLAWKKKLEKMDNFKYCMHWWKEN
jgi:hypothetical protein